MRRPRPRWPFDPAAVREALAEDLPGWNIDYRPALVVAGPPGQHVYQASSARGAGRLLIECVSPADLVLYVDVLTGAA